MKKSATMGVLGEVSESKRSLKLNGNVFQRPTHFLPLWMCSEQIYRAAVQPVQRLYLRALSDNTLLVFQESVL